MNTALIVNSFIPTITSQHTPLGMLTEGSHIFRIIFVVEIMNEMNIMSSLSQEHLQIETLHHQAKILFKKYFILK